MVQGRDGGCTYASKVNHTKKSIARGVIIIDSEKGINNLRPKAGSNFHVFLMSEAEGDEIYKALAGKDDRSFIAILDIGDKKDKK